MKTLTNFILNENALNNFKGNSFEFGLIVDTKITIEKCEVTYESNVYNLTNKKELDEYLTVYKLHKKDKNIPIDKLHLILSDNLELINLDVEAETINHKDVVKLNKVDFKSKISENELFKIFSDIEDGYNILGFINGWDISNEIVKNYKNI